VEELLAEPTRMKKLGEQAQSVFQPHLGGLARTQFQLDEWLGQIPNL